MTRPLKFLTELPNTAVAEPPEPISVESDFVVILAALLCALICVVGLIAVARCAWIRRAAIRSPERTLANKGLKKKVLQTLPKFTFSSAVKTSGSEFVGGEFVGGECAICLTEFVDGDQIRMMPQCGHGFHVGCVDTWLGSHSSCPSCRQVLVGARCQKCGHGQIPSANVAGEAEFTENRRNCFLP